MSRFITITKILGRKDFLPMDTNQELSAIISSRKEAIVNDTMQAIPILLGYEGEDYLLPETDSDWWYLYLWVKRN